MIESLQKLIPWLVGLQTVPKLLFSVIVLLLAAFILAVIWSSPPASNQQPGPANAWPSEKTFSALRRTIERISTTNRRLLAVILEAGKDGIYADELARRTAISRDEVVYRTKELASVDLIEILDLTDKNYRISETVRQLLGGTDTAVLKALLHTDDKPQTEQSATPHKEQSSSGAPHQGPIAEIVGPSTIVVGKRAIYRAEFDGDLEFEWRYTQPAKMTDRNVFVELGFPGQTETLTLSVKAPDGRTFTTTKKITAIAAP
jgi:hypothetical protein